MRLGYLSVQRYHRYNRLRSNQARDFLSFKGNKLDMMEKEIIPLEEIGFDCELRGKINISFGFYLEEIVRGILLT